MNKNIDNSNFLLSLALFKKLYDDKKDIYEIIKLLIIHTLSNDSSITKFTLIEITNKVNNKYSFDIPKAVVKTTLNKIKNDGKLKLINSQYSVPEGFQPVQEISTDSYVNTYIINTLSEYIKTQSKTLPLDVIEKSLESFFLNKRDENNIHLYIESCIVKEQGNDKFINGLNEIKYGLILYESISCGIEGINPNNWNDKIIFLDTEILFYLTSYNGELFKEMSQDFIHLIKIINQNQRIVKLRFLKDTKKELDNFFGVAELIIRNEIPRRQNDVVSYILKKCKESSDVVAMKTDFYSELHKEGIREYEDEIDYNDYDNHEYNLEGVSGLDEKEQKHLKQLSHVNILRKGHKYKTLDKVKYLFLTKTKDTIHLSIKNKKPQDFPLALSLFDLTNQLWIKTNKGLGNESLPATFDIRNQAKIALSSSLAKKVSEEYDKTYRQYADKEICKESIISTVADLRKKELLPDDINESNCEEITSLIIDSDSMERHYEEKEHHKAESERKGQEIEDKNLELDSKNKEIEKLCEKDIERKARNNKIIKRTKRIICVLIISILVYFKSEILGGLPSGELIFYGITSVSSIFGILTFFDIDSHKIKSFLKK